MMRASVAVALCVAAGVVSAETPLSVASIEARLYYNYSGTFSKPLTAKSNLWNTVVGEGDAREASNSTFVEVIVAGETGSYVAGQKVELEVSDSSDGKLIQKTAGEVGVLNVSGRYRVGFWIPKTGCQPLRLRARIAGGKAWKTSAVPFACGE